MPEGEYHEIGLLYVQYLLKQRGFYVDYLGANVPMVDLRYLSEFHKVDYLYCHLTSPAKDFKIQKFFDQLAEVSKQTPIIISGQLAQAFKGAIAGNIQLKKTLQETISFLDSI